MPSERGIDRESFSTGKKGRRAPHRGSSLEVGKTGWVGTIEGREMEVGPPKKSLNLALGQVRLLKALSLP